MAVVTTKIGATPNRVRYRSVGFGTGTLTRADLIDDCAAGPLKKFFERVVADAVWTDLQDDMRLSSSFVQELVAAADEFFILNFTGNPQVVNPGMGGSDGSYTVRWEFQFNHSLVR